MINPFANLPHLQITSKQMMFFVVAMIFQSVAIILATKLRFLLPLLPNSNNRINNTKYIE